MYSREQKFAIELFERADEATKNIPILPESRSGKIEEEIESYKYTLKVKVINDLNEPSACDLLEKMYKIYEESFPLEGEREELDKLKLLLQNNSATDKQDDSAPFREQWIVVQDSKEKDVLSACNFITFSTANDPEQQQYIDGTIHCMYIFVLPRVRNRGLAEFTGAQMEKEARRFIASTFDKDRDPQSLDIVLFAEQNAPLKMSPEAFLRDTEGAKTDQFIRRDLFEKAGFRELDFSYTQLPLQPREQGGIAEKRLDLIARGYPNTAGVSKITPILKSLHPEIVQFHLYNFFHRSVAAGSYHIESDHDWKQQQKALEQLSLVSMKPQQNFLGLKKPTWDKIKEYIESTRFNNEAFMNKSISLFIGNSMIPPL